MRADSPQPPQHVRQMRPEHPSIRVHLVNNHVFQMREKAVPARVVRQDALVEHVRVGQDHVAAVPQLAAQCLRRVAVVRAGEEVHA